MVPFVVTRHWSNIHFGNVNNSSVLKHKMILRLNKQRLRSTKMLMYSNVKIAIHHLLQ